MKLLQALVALLTLLLFFVRQKYVSAGVCPKKRLHINSLPDHGDSNLASCLPSSAYQFCLQRISDEVSMPKYKKDPKIKVDNEDIDGHPIE